MHVRLIRSLEQIGSDNDYPELPSIKYKYLQPNHIFPDKKPTKDNLKKIYMHLTNYSINKVSKNWVDESEVEDILEINRCSKRTLSALWK